MNKSSITGALLPVFSLPGDFGIGCFDRFAKRWLDVLYDIGMNAWQICPLGPTGFGNSPYQPLSEFALNPLFIDIEDLCKHSWLLKNDLSNMPVFSKKRVDYNLVSAWKKPLLLKAYENFLNQGIASDFQKFKAAEGEDLDVFATFCALKVKFGYEPWWEWPLDYRGFSEKSVKEYQKSYKKFIDYFKFEQWILAKQWENIHDYAKSKGIEIIGDIPLYVGLDSVVVWENRALFDWDMDKDQPKNVAGVPPDYFSATGQLWGNPVYDWQFHKETQFKWWMKRIRKNLEWFDRLRLDHFRGLYDYWSVPFGHTTAQLGKWAKGPRSVFFKELKANWPNMPFILEDLGDLSNDVRNFQKKLKMPGMAILQFAFDGSKNPYLPERWTSHQVVYTGTHDNDTTRGWFEKLDEKEQENVYKVFGKHIDVECISTELIMWMFKHRTTQSIVIPLQDILNLGSSARMNAPGTLGTNWCWRCSVEDFDKVKTWAKNFKIAFKK